ncbi:molybdopterin-guanine dinucleotide biosynthesis protein MobA [Loktanella sp. S4079]|nr:DUF3305 domain-containing protein [Loktanella sp. S4079]KJZ20454.1 molybdopterin-guanine dinucleotide biosynthesis protein MobA [Loktanella sp. S4079]
MPMGVVIRRAPGVTRWAKFAWRVVDVIPGAGPADWRVLREEDGVTEYHAQTVALELHGAESEAYLTAISDRDPALYVVMRHRSDPEHPFDIKLVTASPYEGQDYADNGDDVVEKVRMPEGVVAWVRDFAQAFYQEEVFVKRRRDKKHVDGAEDGIGDARIMQMTDVYRAPTRKGAGV